MLREQIVKAAKNAGFAKVGIAPLYKYEELIHHFELRGTTPFVKSNERRIDPEIYAKGANRAITCLLPYFDGNDTSVARYIRGGDYHKPVKERLKQVAEELGLDSYKLLVDSGGLPDRYLAYLAGLGWYGDNNLFYSEGLGCRFYIGSILTTLDIEPDQPIENKCLHCGLCINNCPTGALSAPFTLDPYKCVSYLTQSENLTDEQKAMKEKGVYTLGCDHCQDCCPYNKGE
ncbi:MAG: DUF1730 domain-containing protein [Eubacteriales bacterium]|nr:DUF1730 domain-containing protein [Eubacteriales bacterium]